MLGFDAIIYCVMCYRIELLLLIGDVFHVVCWCWCVAYMFWVDVYAMFDVFVSALICCDMSCIAAILL